MVAGRCMLVEGQEVLRSGWGRQQKAQTSTVQRGKAKGQWRAMAPASSSAKGLDKGHGKRQGV